MKNSFYLILSLTLFVNMCEHETTLNDKVCEVLIANPLVALCEEPKHFSQEIIRVPIGKYNVLESTYTLWVDKKERWLKIKVENREGWIQDDIITIAKKSNPCE